MINEIELVYLSIFFERLGWKISNFTVEEHLVLMGYAVKVRLT